MAGIEEGPTEEVPIMEDVLFPEPQHITNVTRGERPDSSATILATRDHMLIREWARLFDAEPATGEATASGRSVTMKVADGGAGLRFNFPGMGRFRPISWNEWFDHFNQHDLTFVFENPEGRQPPRARYRLMRTKDLT
jgi:hypothetical protein